jgi:hypothetical protein
LPTGTLLLRSPEATGGVATCRPCRQFDGVAPLIPLHRRGKFHPLLVDEIRGGVPFCLCFSNPRQPSADTPFEKGAVGATATAASQSVLRANTGGSPTTQSTMRASEALAPTTQSVLRANSVRPYGYALRASEGARPYNAIRNAGERDATPKTQSAMRVAQVLPQKNNAGDWDGRPH